MTSCGYFVICLSSCGCNAFCIHVKASDIKSVSSASAPRRKVCSTQPAKKLMKNQYCNSSHAKSHVLCKMHRSAHLFALKRSENPTSACLENQLSWSSRNFTFARIMQNERWSRDLTRWAITKLQEGCSEGFEMGYSFFQSNYAFIYTLYILYIYICMRLHMLDMTFVYVYIIQYVYIYMHSTYIYIYVHLWVHVARSWPPPPHGMVPSPIPSPVPRSTSSNTSSTTSTSNYYVVLLLRSTT